MARKTEVLELKVDTSEAQQKLNELHRAARWEGWRSTKLHLALIVGGTITAAFFAMGCPESQFPAFGGFLLGTLTAYAASNTVAGVAHSKHEADASAKAES